jgi:signal transduction histidine kinase
MLDTGIDEDFALIFIEDVTRTREQAQQLKLAALGRLTASIAHEIRNPLSAISHATELLAEETGEDGRARLYRIIHDNTLADGAPGRRRPAVEPARPRLERAHPGDAVAAGIHRGVRDQRVGAPRALRPSRWAGMPPSSSTASTCAK